MNFLNLTDSNWIDLVFDDRNKAYGAYNLRKENNKTLLKSFIVGSTLFLIPFILFLSIRNSEKINKDFIDDSLLHPNVIPDDFIEVTPRFTEIKSTVKSKVDVIKFTEMVAVDANSIKDEVVTINELLDGVIGSENIVGDANGTLLVNETAGESNQISSDSGNEINANTIFDRVEIQAIPNGGLDKFYKSFAQKYNAPDLDEGVTTVSVIVRFVVEIDGSISNISILRDPGMGAGKEAVRVLRTMPKWIPAVQNGKHVRSNFTLPIKIKV